MPREVNHSGVFLRLISETRDFVYGPSKGTARELVFYTNKEIKDPEGDLDGWTVAYNGKHKEHELHLYSKGALVALLRLTPRGYWEGKDLRHRAGSCRITPQEAEQKKWQNVRQPAPTEIPDNSDAGVLDEAFIHMLGDQPLADPRFKSLDLSDMWTHPEPAHTTATALIGYDRPDYFKEVVTTLAANPEFHQYPLFVFLDKTPDSATTKAHLKVLRDLAIEPAAVIRRPLNFGCGRNIIDVRRQLFDHLGFDRIFVFEDDMMVTPEYMKVCENLMDWAEENYDNIGVVQAWDLCKHDMSYKKMNLDSVYATFNNLWGYLMTRKCWDRIKEYLFRYEDLFLNVEYGQRNHELIRKWLFHQINYFEGARVNGIHYPTSPQYLDEKEKSLTFPVSGQDGVTMSSIYLTGQVRLTTRVNRGYYIGEEGIHQTTERYKMAGFHDMSFDSFAGDRELHSFAPDKNDMGEVINGLRYVEEV